jgi:hypothetical protein
MSEYYHKPGAGILRRFQYRCPPLPPRTQFLTGCDSGESTANYVSTFIKEYDIFWDSFSDLSFVCTRDGYNTNFRIITGSWTQSLEPKASNYFKALSSAINGTLFFDILEALGHKRWWLESSSPSSLVIELWIQSHQEGEWGWHLRSEDFGRMRPLILLTPQQPQWQQYQ